MAKDKKNNKSTPAQSAKKPQKAKAQSAKATPSTLINNNSKNNSEQRGIFGGLVDSIFGRNSSRKPRRLYRVLSLDGGGVRGMVQAQILAEVERQMGKPISECFDMIVGTSTGAIVGMGLACPDDNIPGKPKYTADEIVDFYGKVSEEVFPQSRMNMARQILRRKHDHKPLEKLLKGFFGNNTLKDACTGVMVSALETERAEPLFMRFKGQGKEQDGHHDENFYIRDVLRGATAAPTYFEPANIYSLEEREGKPPRRAHTDDKRHSLVDGALFNNQPALTGLFEALMNRDSEDEILVFSVSSGGLKTPYNNKDVKKWGLSSWVDPRKDVPLLQMMIAGQAGTADYKMEKILGNRYIRMEIDLDDENLPANAQPNPAIDDATPENMKSIDRYARFIIDNKEKELQRLYKILNDDFSNYPRKKAKSRFWGFGRNEEASRKAKAKSDNNPKKSTPPAAKGKGNSKPKKSIFSWNSKP